MNPFQRFQQCIHVLRVNSEVISREIFEEKAQFSKQFYVILFLLLINPLGCLYTIKYYDQAIAFSATTSLLGFSQNALRYMVMMDLRLVMDVIGFLESIYQSNLSEIAREHALCQRFAKRSQMIVILVPVMYAMAGSFYQLPKVYLYFTTGVITPTMGVYYPTINGLEEFCAAFTQLLNVGGCIATGMVGTAIDSLVYMVFANIPMISTIIERDLDELNVLGVQKSSPKEMKLKLLKIVKMHLDYNE